MPKPILKKSLQIALRIAVFIAVLELLPRIGAGIFLGVQQSQNRISPQGTAGEVRVMCLGESTTALGGENAYPRQLERVLNERQNKIKYRVINKGIPSVTTEQIAKHLVSYLEDHQPQIVVAMIGINDGIDSVLVKNTSADNWEQFFSWSKTWQLVKFLLSKRAQKEKESSSDRDPALLRMEVDVIKNPSPRSLTKLASLYRVINELDNERSALELALQLKPDHFEALNYLGLHYKRQGKYDQAIEYFQRIIAHDVAESDGKVLAYENLAESYKLNGQYDKAEETFRAEIKYLPINPKAYGELGNLFMERQQFAEAEKLYIKQLRFNPNNEDIYGKLAHCYRRNNEMSKAENLLWQAFTMLPNSLVIATELGTTLLESKKYAQAQQVLLKAVEFAHQGQATVNIDFYEKLLQSYVGQNKNKEAQQTRRLMKKQRSHGNPNTAANYQRIADQLNQRNIKLLAMQYPLRDIQALKNMLKDWPDVILVENREDFQAAIAKDGYDAYFIDRFAGDFGHCTPKGNALIAGQLAEIILQQR